MPWIVLKLGQMIINSQYLLSVTYGHCLEWLSGVIFRGCFNSFHLCNDFFGQYLTTCTVRHLTSDLQSFLRKTGDCVFSTWSRQYCYKFIVSQNKKYWFLFILTSVMLIYVSMFLLQWIINCVYAIWFALDPSDG